MKEDSIKIDYATMEKIEALLGDLPTRDRDDGKKNVLLVGRGKEREAVKEIVKSRLKRILETDDFGAAATLVLAAERAGARIHAVIAITGSKDVGECAWMLQALGDTKPKTPAIVIISGKMSEDKAKQKKKEFEGLGVEAVFLLRDLSSGGKKLANALNLVMRSGIGAIGGVDEAAAFGVRGSRRYHVGPLPGFGGTRARHGRGIALV